VEVVGTQLAVEHIAVGEEDMVVELGACKVVVAEERIVAEEGHTAAVEEV